MAKGKRRKRGSVKLASGAIVSRGKPALSEELEREFLRWCAELGSEEPADGVAIDSKVVLRAHFLVAEYFHRPGHGMAAVGPKSVHLLQSAVSRQFVGFEERRKWTDVFDISATLFYGLVKNH